MLALSVAAAANGPGPRAERADAPVALIDGKAVSGAEYRTYLATYMRSKLYHGGSPERVRELAGEALDNLILDRLLSEEVDLRGIPGDRAAVDERIGKIRARYGKSEEWAQIEPRLPELERELLTETRIEALRDEIMIVAPPDEATLRAFHAANPILFTEPRSWELDLILIGVPPSGTAVDWVEAGRKAEDTLAALGRGEDFAALAAERSTHASAAEGGRLGRVHGGQLPTELETALADVPVGGVTPAVRVLEGYALARVISRNDERLRPYDEVRERVAALYVREQSKRQWSAFIAGLRASAEVEVFDITAHVQTLLHENR